MRDVVQAFVACGRVGMRLNKLKKKYDENDEVVTALQYAKRHIDEAWTHLYFAIHATDEKKSD